MVAVFLLFIVFTYNFFFKGTPGYNSWTIPFPVSPVLDNALSKSTTPDLSPDTSQRFKNVQVIIKSGTVELETKLATHLKTVTSIVPLEDLFIFSDAPSKVDKHTVLDALEDLPEAYTSQYPEFETYKKQKDALLKGTILEKSGEGWKLDKHKFLPMISKTWAMQPDKEFYFFIEADTFVFWETMLSFLDGLDSAKPLYMGAPIAPTIWPHPAFAYGGAGFVLSRGAMLKVLKNEHRYGAVGTHQMGMDLRDECCGDAILADLLKSHGVLVKGYWPLFNGDDPATVPFGGGKGFWCEPFGTLHHITPKEMSRLWEWRMAHKEGVRPTKPTRRHPLC
ncbi:MAG: hypothetical protein ACRYGG_09350 [Janthinobacterium lividum]